MTGDPVLGDAPSPAPPPAEPREPPTRVGRFKRWAENNAILSALLVLCAIIGGAAGLSRDVRELILPFLRPRVAVEVGPALTLDYEPFRHFLRATFPLVLKGERPTTDHIDYDPAMIKPVPFTRRPIYIGGPALSCEQDGKSISFPVKVEGHEWVTLSCSLSQLLSIDADSAFLTPGYSCIQLTFHGVRKQPISRAVCYYMMKETIAAARRAQPGEHIQRFSTTPCQRVLGAYEEKELCGSVI